MALRSRFAKRLASTTAVSLRDPLHLTAASTTYEVPDAPPETQIDVLSNGIRLSAEDTMGPSATVGLYVDAGSAYENSNNSGISHLLERMAFKTTMHRSQFRLIREVEAMGANLLASASREQMAYTIDGARHNLPEMVEVLVDSVINPKFQPWEIKEQVERIKEELTETEKNPQSYLMEALHETGYTGGLGMPLVALKDTVSSLSAEDCMEFVSHLYTGPRIVLAGSGVSQKALVSAAEPLLSGLSSSPGPSPMPSKYVGGDYRRRSGGGMTNMVLGFESPGGWRDFKASVVATLMQMLMGGGGSFSAGGPGLVGINISAESHKADQAVGAICDEMLALATKGAISEVELERAKLALISSVYMNLESKVVIAEDIGRQILTYGHRKRPEEFVDAVKKVTAADIQKAATAMFKKPPTVACCGDVSNVPHYDAIKSRF